MIEEVIIKEKVYINLERALQFLYENKNKTFEMGNLIIK